MNTTKRAYSIPEVAKIIGLSRQSVYDHVIKGHIPCIKISDRTWRVPGAWVDGLVNGTLEAPSAPPQPSTPPAKPQAGGRHKRA